MRSDWGGFAVHFAVFMQSVYSLQLIVGRTTSRTTTLPRHLPMPGSGWINPSGVVLMPAVRTSLSLGALRRAI